MKKKKKRGEERKYIEDLLSGRKILYNGPHSKEAEFFISQIEARLDKRPWNPAEEVSVMRALAVTIREFFGKEKEDG